MNCDEFEMSFRRDRCLLSQTTAAELLFSRGLNALGILRGQRIQFDVKAKLWTHLDCQEIVFERMSRLSVNSSCFPSEASASTFSAADTCCPEIT